MQEDTKYPRAFLAVPVWVCDSLFVARITHATRSGFLILILIVILIVIVIPISHPAPLVDTL